MRQRLTSLQPGKDLPEVSAAFRAHQPEMVPGEPRSWYSIKNISKDETEVFIYDEIGFWGVSASDFLSELSAVSTPRITLRINSPGGDVFDGIAIYNAIRRQEASVSVFVDGLAASAASFIAMAGDTVTMSPKSQLMIHEAFGFAVGPAEDMRKMAEMLDKTSDNIASIYADRAGGTTEEWRDMMRAETWFSDREAVGAGLADGIDGEEAENRASPVRASSETPATEEVSPAPDYGALFEEIVEADIDELFAAA